VGLVNRTVWHLVLMIGAAACVSPASAAFFLDLSAVNDHQISLVLKSDTPTSLVESIDIQLDFDLSALELVGKPTFETVLTGSDFKFGQCGQRLLPGNVFKSNCGGYFEPKRALLQSGGLVRWLFEVMPGPSQTTMFDLSITLGEDDPILLSEAASLPIPEPGPTALMLAGLGLLGLRRVLQRSRSGSRD
jgi:hypothetical protein